MDGARLKAVSSTWLSPHYSVCNRSASFTVHHANPAWMMKLFLLDYPKLLSLLSPPAFPSFPLSFPPPCCSVVGRGEWQDPSQQ